MSQWEALPCHRGGREEQSVGWPVTVAAAALVCYVIAGGRGGVLHSANMSHYVMSIFSKNFEKILYDRLVSLIVKFKILTENQYGFQKNKSTISGCQSFIGNVQEALDRRSFAVGMFFDLTKTYDVVILLEKLDHYGI
jgi:hypothetical protein